ncbi:hypothetical protein [Enterovibrio norvegicus]|uniref:hypothetical protein n=1 Tax=Enterovibrio norvegicus TaxID=188144 RepID=UPI00352D45E1
MNKLINTSTLTARLSEQGAECVIATAKATEAGGYLLYVTIDNDTFVLSTWRSTTPRLFKRADALLTEATNLGLTAITFAL